MNQRVQNEHDLVNFPQKAPFEKQLKNDIKIQNSLYHVSTSERLVDSE